MTFPKDFPQRLEQFEGEGGLSWSALARCLGVNPYRRREWRRGTVPDSTNLFIFITLADNLELRGFSCVLIGILASMPERY